MPSSSLRRRVYGLLRSRFSPADSLEEERDQTDIQAEDDAVSPTSPEAAFYTNAFLAGIDGRRLQFPEVYSGKTGLDLPQISLEEFDREVIATYTGPSGGLTQVGEMRKQAMARIANIDDEMSISMENDTDESDEEDVDAPLSAPQKRSRSRSQSRCLMGSCSSLLGGTDSDNQPSNSTSEKYDWNHANTDCAFGLSTSLYERNPLTGVNAGEPIADVFALMARNNNAILALADGVNWGEGARLAARCAVRGAVDHLNSHILNKGFQNTTEVFHELLGSFHSAHSLILQEGGMLTTLCVAVIAPAQSADSWVLCVCNVGDSLCFVYNKNYGVREVTLGSHDIDQMRDMRDAGGALGPVDGRNPQLHNLTCSMTFVEEGDIVFITSDGVSDNFDPVVGKFCVIKKEENKENDTLPPLQDRKLSVTVKDGGVSSEYSRARTCAASLPCVDAAQRHELTLVRMRDVIANGLRPVREKSPGATSPRHEFPLFPSVSASILCRNLVQFATLLSAAKRKTLENPELYKKEKMSKTEQRQRRKMVREKIGEMPGKLDHASVVAYRVGHVRPISKQERTLSMEDMELENLEEPGCSFQVQTCRHHFENFHRQAHASCSGTVLLRNGDRSSASLTIKLSSKPPLPPLQIPVTQTVTRPSDVSPYEELPVLTMESNRRKKHARGSAARHTLGVDVQWLKKLVTKKVEKSVSPPDSPQHGPTSERSENSVSRERISLRKRIRGFLGSNKAVNLTDAAPSPINPSRPPRPCALPLQDTARTPLRSTLKMTSSASRV